MATGTARPKGPGLDFYEEAAAVDERIAEMELDRGDEPPSLELARLRRWRHVMARLADQGQAQTLLWPGAKRNAARRKAGRQGLKPLAARRYSDAALDGQTRRATIAPPRPEVRRKLQF